MSVRPYTDADASRWDHYVERAGSATCYHHTRWKRVMEQTFRWPTHYLLSEDARSAVNGVLPLVTLKSRLFGHFLVSLPYIDHCGICADGPGIARELLEHAIEIARTQGAGHLELREDRPLDSTLPVKTAKVAMRLDLPETAEDLWRSFPSKLRSQIRRPGREGMQARIGAEDELDAFYGVYASNMRDLGAPAQSKSLFRNMLRELPESTWICSVYTGEQPVAAGFLVGFQQTLQIPWASSLRSHNRAGPNMLMYWTALTLGCEKGFGVFDFGRSTSGEGTYRFKEQWGARPAPLYWYYWLREGTALPELGPKNPRYQAAIRVWRRLPVRLTTLLGPRLIGKLA
jgi:FemAB-related protein (PEP-CTERM system-associated)